ncbi:tetratricopeptide repeat protein [candidate division KSB1 bacterium]|nr:MAG: tetratricopeptide repeat protein [candidate division KSB1 bacterium]
MIISKKSKTSHWNKLKKLLVLCLRDCRVFACESFKIVIYFDLTRGIEKLMKNFRYQYFYFIIVFAFLTGCSSSRKMAKPVSRPQYNSTALNHIIDGAVMELLERPNDALLHYHQAAELDSTSPGIYITMAENYYLLEKPDVSIRLAQKALRLDPGNLDALYILAAAYEANKEFVQAMAVYERIVEILPNDIESLFYLTSLQIISNRPKEALKTYKQMVKSGLDEPHYLVSVGNLFLRSEAYTEAEQVYLDIYERHPDVEAVYLALAATSKMQKDKDTAIAWYEKALAYNPAFDDAKAELQQIYENDKNWDAAISLYEKLVAMDSSNLSDRLQLGQYYYRQKDFSRAHEVYEEAVGDNPFSERAYLALAALYMTQADTTAAIGTLKQAIEKKSSFYRARRTLSEIYAAQKHWDEAIALYEPLKDNDTTFVGARIEIAYLLVDKGDTLQAIQNIEPLMETHGDDWRVPTTLGRFSFIRDDLPTAVDYFDKAIQLRDDLPHLWVLRGIAHIQMDSLDQALENFENAAVKFPKEPEIHYYVGTLLSRQKKYAKAISYYLTALELDPQNDQVALSLAGAYDELKQYDHAEKLYTQLLKANPDSPIILNNYAYHLSVQAKELEMALELSKRAVEAEPENAPYLDTLGWIYYQMGDYQQAKYYIEKALEKSPDTAEVIEHLGDVYEKLGDQALAEELWRKAYELDDRRVKLLEKLDPEK